MSQAKDLGTRHVCWKCDTKYYDLHRPSPTCPKCGSDPKDNPALRSPPAKLVSVPTAVGKEEIDPDEDLDADDDDLLDDDLDDLGDDVDDEF